MSHDPLVNLRRNSINLFADKEDLVTPVILSFLSLSTSKKPIKLEFNFVLTFYFDIIIDSQKLQI